MYTNTEIGSIFNKDAEATSEFRAYFEQAFASLEELDRKQAIKITPVQHMGRRVKEEVC